MKTMLGRLSVLRSNSIITAAIRVAYSRTGREFSGSYTTVSPVTATCTFWRDESGPNDSFDVMSAAASAVSSREIDALILRRLGKARALGQRPR